MVPSGPVDRKFRFLSYMFRFRQALCAGIMRTYSMTKCQSRAWIWYLLAAGLQETVTKVDVLCQCSYDKRCQSSTGVSAQDSRARTVSWSVSVFAFRLRTLDGSRKWSQLCALHCSGPNQTVVCYVVHVRSLFAACKLSSTAPATEGRGTASSKSTRCTHITHVCSCHSCQETCSCTCLTAGRGTQQSATSLSPCSTAQTNNTPHQHNWRPAAMPAPAQIPQLLSAVGLRCPQQFVKISLVFRP
jgi:hypothetical protein